MLKELGEDKMNYNDIKYPVLGAAYYPEAWDESEQDRDIAAMQKAGIKVARMAEFAWAKMEPREGEYDFSLFREVVDKCRERGLSVIMCPPSAAPPVWMTHKYPEIFADFGYAYVKTLAQNFYGITNTKAYRAMNLDVQMISADELLSKAEISVIE
jgi:beta-galactosidase GanA